MVPTTSTSPPTAAPRATAPPLESIALIGPTTYEVHRADAVVGYIDIVGGVYVALSGSRYDHAVEVRQSIVLDTAVAALTQPPAAA
ncbi:hypothetical protein IT882_01115 [Microbacterium schleiferi]|uniref:Uncharacterized protein n=1 Tax=Microbacterium schleiferi TaxID=69362 RepID=A0A7S8MWX0_9MICO|nr:hypothetical protein [Microbacterium schleiferi]QPE04784.1 hypothetical protein IT882_01115 [Microbacterium schleiferi]